MRRFAAGILLALNLGWAQPLIPPPSLPLPPIPGDLGGIVGLLCQFFGEISIQIEGWQINFCEINRFLEKYNTNTQLFLKAQDHMVSRLDRPLVQTGWYIESLNENLGSLGRAPLPAPTEPRGSPAEIYRKALEKDIPIEKAEEAALETIADHYGDVFGSLRGVVDSYSYRVNDYTSRLRAMERSIQSLQKRLEKTLPGTEEAQRIIARIHEIERNISKIQREAMDYTYREAPRVLAAHQAAKQAFSDIDKLITDLYGQTNRLAATKAAKRIAEAQAEEFAKLIEETNKKAAALVKEAQNATSTRAAVQILAKGLAQLTTTTAVTQSLLHSALAELAQQAVYTNQQIAQSANIMAKNAAIEYLAKAEEIQAIISENLGKMRVLQDQAEALQKAKVLLFDNPCVTRWHLGCGIPNAKPLIPPP